MSQQPDSKHFDAGSVGAGTSGTRRGATVFSTAQWFRDVPWVWIDHGGERYLLRQTRQGKLILTK